MKTIECSQHSEGDVALREACLDSLTTFAEAFGSNYRAAAVHRHLACKLQDCARRKIRRIVISCPPRTGKSLLTSIMFPAWSLTKAPALKIIQASYSSELSELFSRATKAVLTSEPYRAFTQVLGCARELSLDVGKLNRRGGAIALGHPIGCSGARILVTLLHLMEDLDLRRGIASLCVGGGMGVALALER